MGLYLSTCNNKCVVLDRPVTFHFGETEEDNMRDTTKDPEDEYDTSSDEEV